MSDFGSGYTILAQLLPSSSTLPTFDDILTYLRSSSLGGLKYTPSDTRTLTLSDAYHALRKYCPAVDLDILILRPQTPTSHVQKYLNLASLETDNNSSSVEDDGWTVLSDDQYTVALYDNVTSEWSVLPPATNIEDILPPPPPPSSTPPPSKDISGEEYKALIRLTNTPTPPPPLPQKITETFTSIETSTCNINAVASKSSTDVESLNLPPEPFIYGDVTLPGVNSILHSLSSLSPSLPPTSTFVDLGSGSGLALLAVSLINPVQPYLGVELLPSLVDISKTIDTLDPSSIIQADFLDGSYDWWSSSHTDSNPPRIYFSHCTVVFSPTQLSLLSSLFKRTSPNSVFVAVGNPLPNCEIVHEFLMEVSWGVEIGILQINK
ncbi:hypothetical protein TrLO_g9217 [Triparma laevis f. longispina]|uniref:DOT1 domain-containing protein n=1 Tax=Triparma laevis f. longispina TaxID=1714387 RepID=A0A9W7F6Y6_9STRA|nr:hypothetical protein TrLO_g9217 [Triparma laevis f. longispina]